MRVDIRVKTAYSTRVPRGRLRQAVERALRTERSATAPAIYVTDDAEMRSLNRSYHAVDASTDVLSFPAAAGDSLGDIVISYDRARAQAHAAGWPIVRELELLVVHGTLHLLGYDDGNARARKKMWERQTQILGRPIPEIIHSKRSRLS